MISPIKKHTHMKRARRTIINLYAKLGILHKEKGKLKILVE